MAAALAAILLPAPGTSHGASNFGDNLVASPTHQSFCGPDCTQWNTNIYLANTAGTVASPIDGVLVAWAFKTMPVAPGTAMKPIHARIIEPVGSQWRGGPATADIVPATSGGVQSHPTRLPIHQGDHLGVDYSGFAYSPPMFADNIFGAVMKLRAPQFPAGGPPQTFAGNHDWQVFLRGTVEPDADGDGFGDETQDKCPGVVGPNAGCQPAKTKKKCKRKKKRRSKQAAAAKKKEKKRCRKKGKKRR
jgi:hypothetical protein